MYALGKKGKTVRGEVWGLGGGRGEGHCVTDVEEGSGAGIPFILILSNFLLLLTLSHFISKLQVQRMMD